MNIVIFGPPGAGKGTQSNIIVEKFNLHQLSTGALLRKEIENKTVFFWVFVQIIDVLFWFVVYYLDQIFYLVS